MTERIADGCGRAALMRMRAIRVAQPMRREILLQSRCCGRRREDLPDQLVGDRDDSLVGLLAVREKLQGIPAPPGRPDRASAADPNSSDVSAR
jgi:hypothetical protein